MVDKPKQELFKLAAAIETGEDEGGKYHIIPLSMVRGGELKPTKVYDKPMRHIVNGAAPAPRGWYKNKHEPKRVRPRPCYTEALLTTPYGGYCHVGCKFCYVDNGTRGYRSTGIATANPEYPDYMRRQVAKMNICGAAYMSSFAEPFQILENQYHITQRLSDVFIDNGLPIFYLSRLLPPDWAVDALQANPYSYMQWSVNTSNDIDYKRMSPGSYHIEEVIKSVERLSKLGIYTSFQVNPVLPGITTVDELVELVRLGANAGLKHVIFKFAEQVTGNKKILLERLRSAGLDGVDRFEEKFTQVIGGVYTVEQELRVEWLNILLGATRDAHITMSTCYEYYNDGAAGANMAPYFTTSDQCHGRGVPMFFRPGPDQKFQPLPGCYRKGCLYCAEYGTHACGNETLLEAKALTHNDYKNIRLDYNDANWTMEESCLVPSKAIQMNRVFGNPGFMTDMEWWDVVNRNLQA